MSDTVDLREVLKDWPYDPAHNVRVANCPDGREVLQVRLPVGLEQYELEGHPGGQQPYGQESALDYQLARFSQAKVAGKAGSFSLNAEACAELFHEGILYYHRYLHLFELQDWGRTLRDTARNLTLFDFVHAHATREEDRNYMEQWRPYLLRMNAVAAAMKALNDGQMRQALELVNVAIDRIEALPDLEVQTFQFERERSLSALREIAVQIQKNSPPSEIEALEAELRQAIAAEHFERAAQIRDQLRSLRRDPSGAPPGAP